MTIACRIRMWTLSTMKTNPIAARTVTKVLGKRAICMDTLKVHEENNLIDVSLQIAIFPKDFFTVRAALGLVFIILKVHILIQHLRVIRHLFFFHLI